MDPTTLTYVANTTEDLQANLRIRQADKNEDSDKEQSPGRTSLSGGDTVTISEQGQRLSGQAVQKVEESGESDTEQTLTEQRIQRLEERIEEIQQEIEEVNGDSDLDAEEKQKKIQTLTAELMQAQQELSELQSSSGSTGGGTPAEGFANGLT